MSSAVPNGSLLCRAAAYFAIGVTLLLAGAPEARCTTIVYVVADTTMNRPATAAASSDTAYVDHSIPDALARIRKLRAESAHGPFRIEILPGRYVIETPIKIGSEDSGTSVSPLVIEGSDRDTVILTGALPLTVALRDPPASVMNRIPRLARQFITAFNLADNGISDWAGPTEYGFGIGQPPGNFPSRLVIDDSPATLARWPQVGFSAVANVTAPALREFAVDPPFPAAWAYPLEGYAFGYWGNSWSSETLKVAVRNSSTLALEGKQPPYGVKAGQSLYLLNVPEALATPGQWFFDAAAGNVYAYSPPGHSSASYAVANTVSIFTIRNASHIIIRHITVRDARADLIDADSVDGLVVEDCKLENAGHVAVDMTAAMNSGLRHCTVDHSAGTAVHLAGGDRRELIAGNDFLQNSVITNFGEILRTYEPAVRLEGVGATIGANDISNGPHAAIIFSGNDHVIEHNVIHNVANETDDVGAIYSGRDWTARGTRIQHNYFHDINGVGSHGASGVYLDDQASGISVYDNLFVRVHRGVLIGGGSDNRVVGNLFANVPTAVFMDQRGMTWQRGMTLDQNGTLQKSLQAVDVNSPQYAARYPTLKSMAADGLGVPLRNAVNGNLIIGGNILQFAIASNVLARQDIGTNWETNDPATVWDHTVDLATATEAHRFTLRKDSKWVAQGFRVLELDQFGPGP